MPKPHNQLRILAITCLLTEQPGLKTNALDVRMDWARGTAQHILPWMPRLFEDDRGRLGVLPVSRHRKSPR